MVLLIVGLLLLLIFPLPTAKTSNVDSDEVNPGSKLCSDLTKPLAKNPATIDLIIQFKDGPRDEDKRVVEKLGFSIKRTFHVVPALSVHGPTSRLDELLAHNRVTFVEHNDPVVLDMEMGTWVINATEVWSNLVRTDTGYDAPIDGSGVTVCVVDTGIDAGHPDLDYTDKTIKNVYDVGNGLFLEAENTDTNYGHGTHVAGTVAGNGDASAGARRGVAPGANLIGVTVSIPEEASTPTEDGYIQGLEWVYDNSHPDANPNNIRVVTNSWHSTVGEYDPSMTLTQIIERLTFDNNVVSTWSAGNDGRDDPNGDIITTSQQGNTPVGIVVAAYERDGSAVTDFSSRGQVGLNHTYPDVGAPGRGIWSTSARRTVISSGTYVGGNTNPYYLAISGTSMSTPHVAGLAALLWQAAPSMTLSDLHEDYSGPDPESWYSNPNTVIHELEWILEASARLLPMDEEHGNLAGDSNTTGWDGKPVDYVQGYGIVDAKRAVGIALTLQNLRDKFPLRKITVRDAIAAYDKYNVDNSRGVLITQAITEWSGEFSRYNDQSGNPLSLVNQTKFLIAPYGIVQAVVTLSYTIIDLEEFKAGDLAFSVDYDGDGREDHTSSLSPTTSGKDTLVIDQPPAGLWTFDILGRGFKLQRPLQGINYVELRIEYEMSVAFTMAGMGGSNLTKGNAYYAPVLPHEAAMEGGYSLMIGNYDLRNVTIEEVMPEKPAKKEEFPLGWLALLTLLIIAAVVYWQWRSSKGRKKE
ncbi:S8 family serine peptidase [[Eubacterium] cellulosolvens]